MHFLSRSRWVVEFLGYLAAGAVFAVAGVVIGVSDHLGLGGEIVTYSTFAVALVAALMLQAMVKARLSRPMPAVQSAPTYFVVANRHQVSFGSSLIAASFVSGMMATASPVAILRDRPNHPDTGSEYALAARLCHAIP